MKKKIGLISDTHGLVREEALEALKDCDLIIHAGDIGKIEVVDALKKIAPTYAIKGNIDRDKWTEKFPKTRVVKIGNMSIYVIHNIKKLDINPKEEGFDIVVYGHSHKYKKYIENDILYINPGGAGQRRFNLPVTVAVLYVFQGMKEVEFIKI